MRNILLFSAILIAFTAGAQSTGNSGKISGSFQMDAQSYKEDTLIGAPKVDEKLGMNSFLNLRYANDNFEAGIRYEAYLPVMQGIDPRYKGHGIAHRFARYRNEGLDVTVGDFYEQFGSGMILRSYQEWSLGFDNAIEGIRVKYMPYKGINLTGLIGKQRFFWDKGPGIIRGFDAEITFNDLKESWAEKKTRITLGGSFVGKYQKDQDPIYKLPENVAAGAGRLRISRGKVNIYSEYAYKINDPSSINNYIYKEGQALLIQANYSQKGLGISVDAKRIDNMSFRSDRNVTGAVLDINYLPALSRQHSYALSSFYPYATQPNGEAALQGSIQYKIKKGSKLGGKYGTDVGLNVSFANAIDRKVIDDSTLIGQMGTLGYKSDFFSIGKERYFRDINLEVSRKFSSKFKASVSWVNLLYNIAVIEGHVGDPDVKANVIITEMTFKPKPTEALRLELQHLSTAQDEGNWGMGMVEYTWQKFFVAVMDLYNYGHPDKNRQIHYFKVAAGFMKGTTQMSLSYGKQREGILCVGGVCRAVPAANGLLLTITSSF